MGLPQFPSGSLTTPLFRWCDQFRQLLHIAQSEQDCKAVDPVLRDSIPQYSQQTISIADSIVADLKATATRQNPAAVNDKKPSECPALTTQPAVERQSRPQSTVNEFRLRLRDEDAIKAHHSLAQAPFAHQVTISEPSASPATTLNPYWSMPSTSEKSREERSSPSPSVPNIAIRSSRLLAVDFLVHPLDINLAGRLVCVLVRPPDAEPLQHTGVPVGGGMATVIFHHADGATKAYNKRPGLRCCNTCRTGVPVGGGMATVIFHHADGATKAYNTRPGLRCCNTCRTRVPCVVYLYEYMFVGLFFVLFWIISGSDPPGVGGGNGVGGGWQWQGGAEASAHPMGVNSGVAGVGRGHSPAKKTAEELDSDMAEYFESWGWLGVWPRQENRRGA